MLNEINKYLLGAIEKSATPPLHPGGNMEHKAPIRTLESTSFSTAYSQDTMDPGPANTSTHPSSQGKKIDDDCSDPVHRKGHSRVPTVGKSCGSQPSQPKPSLIPTQEPETKKSPPPPPPQLSYPKSNDPLLPQLPHPTPVISEDPSPRPTGKSVH